MIKFHVFQNRTGTYTDVVVLGQLIYFDGSISDECMTIVKSQLMRYIRHGNNSRIIFYASNNMQDVAHKMQWGL